MSDGNKEGKEGFNSPPEKPSSGKTFHDAILELIEDLVSAGNIGEASDLRIAVWEGEANLERRVAAGEEGLTFKQALLDEHQKRPFLIKPLVLAVEKLLISEDESQKKDRDPLTDAKINRKEYLQKVGDLIKKYLETGRDFSLIYIDLNNLKPINDQFGHVQGDTVLKVLYRVMIESTHYKDEIFRLGQKADEFSIVLPESKEVALEVVNRIFTKLQELNRQRKTGELIVKITAAAGIASISQIIPDHMHDNVDLERTTEALRTAADQAMYEAKAKKEGPEGAESAVEVYEPN